MPEMRKERAPATVNVALDNVQVNVAPPTASVQKSRRLESSAGNVAVPAGGHYVQVRHIDPSGGEITVNGEPLTYGDSWSAESRLDPVSNNMDFVAAVTIQNPSGKIFALRVDFPSSSNFNPETL
jgi:hypothetical protein